MFLYFVNFLIFVGYYYIEVKIMQSVTETEEYKQMQQSALKSYGQFTATLNKEQLNLFEEVLDKLFGLNDMLSKADYEEGVKVGINIVLNGLS